MNLRRALSVCGFGLLVLVARPAGAQVIQNQNSSIGSFAASGPALAVNIGAAQAGPTASALLGGAHAQQFGNNTTILTQHSNARSGDAVAGSQVTGVVGGGGPAVVQNSNHSLGAIGLSGPAAAVNVGAARSGPRANALLGVASASQFGNNTNVVDQVSDARSGDALAGSQVTGVVGGLLPAVQNQNSSLFGLALSGPAFATNFAGVNAGPSASAPLGFASASQVGNNDAILTEAALSHSGDALAGSQSTGAVGGLFGLGLVGGSNFALFPFAASGPTAATNAAVGGPGPVAGPGLGFANTSQAGNNSATLAQFIDSASGDALSGSQTSGLVTQEQGALAAVNKQGTDVPAALLGLF